MTPAALVTGERPALIFPGLVLGAALVALLGLGSGAVAIAPGEVLSILRHWPSGTVDPALGREAIVLVEIRLPRLLAGFAIGAAIAIAGAGMQGLFRNPLADPGLIGISSGAAVAAVGFIVVIGPWLAGTAPELMRFGLPVAAFLGGLVVTALIVAIASRNGTIDVAMLLLGGIAINALAGALIGVLVFMSDDQQLREATFWMMGSLAAITWPALLQTLPLLVLPLLTVPYVARALNALLLGEADAKLLGFAVERTKALVVVVTALAIGAGVAISGMIGFIGLVAPHLARLLVGVDHRRMLPASALLGGTLLVGADLVARLVVLPAELPIGIVTALVGSPFFLWMLQRRLRQTAF